jgi:hypothetical protein
VARMGDRRGAYTRLVGRPEGERDHLQDQAVDGRMILKWRDMDWIDLAQDRDRWQALVNAVMNVRVL